MGRRKIARYKPLEHLFRPSLELRLAQAGLRELLVRGAEKQPRLVLTEGHDRPARELRVDHTRGIRAPRRGAVVIRVTQDEDRVRSPGLREHHGATQAIGLARPARTSLCFVDQLPTRMSDGILVDEPLSVTQVLAENAHAEVWNGLHFALAFDDADEPLHGMNQKSSTPAGSSPSLRSGSDRMSSATENSPFRTTSRCADERGPICVTPSS